MIKVLIVMVGLLGVSAGLLSWQIRGLSRQVSGLKPPAPQRGQIVVTREMYPHLRALLHDARYVDILLADPGPIQMSGSIRIGPGVSIQGFRPEHDPMTGPDWRIPAR